MALTSKEISREADRLFQSVIPSRWIIRNQQDQEDYGIDYEIEIQKEQQAATGLIFKVQQKGETEVSLLSDGKTISFNHVKVERMRYYLEQVLIPVILVVVDLKSRSVYWLRLQGNPDVETAFKDAIKDNQKTVTVHLEISNCLPFSSDKLQDTVGQILKWLVIRYTCQMNPKQLFETMHKAKQIEVAESAISNHNNFLRCDQIERLISNGDQKTALLKALNIFKSPSEDAAMRLAAQHYIVKIEGGKVVRSQNVQEMHRFLIRRVELATQLLQILRPIGAAQHLRIYARCVLRSARLRLKSEAAFALHLSSGIQCANCADNGVKSLTRAQCQNALLISIRELNRALSAFGQMISTGNLQILPLMFPLLVSDSIFLLATLKGELLNDQRTSVLAVLDSYAKISVRVAQKYQNWKDIANCAISYYCLVDPADLDDGVARAKVAREWILEIPEAENRQQELDRLFDIIKKGKQDTSSHDSFVGLSKYLAASLGVDLNDPSDKIAEVVRIGFEDANPERILKNCQHLFVSLGSSGIPAQMLCLPTAGFKLLHCTRYGYCVSALSLDGLYDSFSNFYCTKCANKTAQPPDWKWTIEWQSVQDELHKKLITPMGIS